MKYIVKFTILLIALIPVLHGCVNDDLSDCPPTTADYGIFVKVIPNDDSETRSFNGWDINVVDLFIFNSTGKFIGKKDDVGLDKWIQLDYPSTGNLRVVAVADVIEDNVIISNYEELEDILENFISLKPLDEFDSRKVYTSPDDIFLGNINVDNIDYQTEYKELKVEPIVSKINIKIKGHLPYTMHQLSLPGLPDDDDFVYLISTRHETVDFMGTPCGTVVHYYGSEKNVSDGMCEIITFNMFSTTEGEEVTIYIYYKDTLIDTVKEASLQTRSTNVNPLLAFNGRLLEVLISYESGLNVTLQNVNWWGNETFWKDF